MSGVPLADLITDARAGFASGTDLEVGVLQIRMHNISRAGYLDFTKKRRVHTEQQIERFVLRDNDVLFNATNSPELVGKTALFRSLDEPVVFSNHFIRLRVDDRKLDPAYLTRWLQWQQGRGMFGAMAQRWVNQASVRIDRLLGLTIPLTSLDAQRRIAQILDAAGALRSKRQATIESMKLVEASAFDALFGVPRPGRSRCQPLGDLLERIDSGTSPVCATRSVRQGEWGVLKLGAVSFGEYRPAENKALLRDVIPRAELAVAAGDVLMARKNTLELVGASAYVRKTPPRLLLPDQIFRLVPRATAEIRPI